MLIKTKYSFKNVKLRHIGKKKHGILAKSLDSRQLTKTTVSVIVYSPYLYEILLEWSQMLSKLIFIISSYAISKLVRFLRHSVDSSSL